MRTMAAGLACMLAAVAPAGATRPERATVLTGRAMTDVLKQCSRAAPLAGQGWFRPTPAQIDALDRMAARRLTGRNGLPRVAGAAELKRRFAVEVVGIVRGGRRLVYGNYYLLSMQEGVKDAVVPTIVCDGGPSFFGIEMDAGTGAVTQFDTNGMM